MYPALWNRFPIINSDSGTYIQSAIDNLTPMDRPVFYGYFINWTDVYRSLWFVAFSQNILLALMIWKTMQKFSSGFSWLGFYLTIIVLTAFTTVAWFSSQIMTDVFTPLLLLSAALLLFDSSAKIGEMIFYSAIVFFSCLVHFSHFMLALALVAFILSAKLFHVKIAFLQVAWRRLMLALTVVTLSIVFVPCFNYFKDGKFYFSNGSGILLCSKFVEDGLLKKYLDAHCSEDPNPLCHFKDQLPVWGPEFLYGKTSPVNELGLDSTLSACNKISFRVVETYPLEFALLSLKGASINLFRLDAGTGIQRYDENSSPYFRIEMEDRTEFNQWRTSKQQGNQLDFSLLAIIQRIFVFGTLLILLLNLSTPNLFSSLSQRFISLAQFIILALILNAMITGTLASEHDDRYQTRIAWLIPLIVLTQYQNQIVNGLKRQFGKWNKE
ncbi:MAG TPA: hypothetical protein VE978_03870 [Chitinophagales bacterium]|nr:hypothetical protein [Chitinophagales bacterium]